MTEYQPNFSDKRVISRSKRALGFACGVMNETKPHAWSTRYIDEYFGNQRNSLSRYLRQTLLICVDEYYRYNIPGEKGICKKYILNKDGVELLKESLNLKIKTNNKIYPSVVDLVKTVAQDDYKQELETGKFIYNDKSHRLHHGLQNYRREYKSQILEDYGYTHDYDIECCAPTLIHQYAQQLGMDEYLFSIRKYLDNKHQVRNELAKELEVSSDVVKRVITALFAGAMLGSVKHSDVYEMLDNDTARIRYLQQHTYITELRKDIAKCWAYINTTLQLRTKISSNGKSRKIKYTSKQKWNAYFEQERRVLDSVRTYLDEKNFRYFCQHDGWTTDKEIDVTDLRDYVRNHTGYDIKLDYEIFDYKKIKTNNKIYPSVVDLNK